jgi:hypothetical protein
MHASRLLAVVALALIVAAGFTPAHAGPGTREACSAQAAGAASAEGYTCTCDSPCSGSITCDKGCYAFCEENPEGSGRHVCIKGCSSDALAAKSATLDAGKKYSSVNLAMSRSMAMTVIEKLYGKKATGQVTAARADASPSVAIHLKNADLKAVLAELNK